MISQSGRVSEGRVNADHAPFDAPRVPHDAQLCPHGVDDRSLPLIGHRGPGDAVAARNVRKTIRPEANFAHAVEAGDRQI